MGYLYQGVGSVASKSAENLLNVFEWAIHSFAPKHGFPKDLLFSESEDEFYKMPPPEDENMRAIWIGRRFFLFKDWCQMSKWPISFKVEPEKLITRRKGRTQQNRLTEIHASRYDEKYYVDDHGRTVFYYKDEYCDRLGYINHRIIMKFADMLHKTAEKPIFVRMTPNKDLYIVCGVFMGLGHLFCTPNRGQKILFNYDSIESKAAFTLAIYFKLRGISRRQAMKQCGHLMRAETKKELKVAYRHLLLYKKRLVEIQEYYDEVTRPIPSSKLDVKST